jgi:hypothetical protein
MINPISLKEAKNNLGFIRVFRYNKKFSILNLSKISISSCFINEDEINSKDDLSICRIYDNKINSESYLSLDDLIKDLKFSIINFFTTNIDRHKIILNKTSIFSKMTKKHRVNKNLLLSLEDSYIKFLSTDFQEFLDITEDVNLDLGFEYIPLKSNLYYLKRSGVDLTFDKIKIKSVRLFKVGTSYSIEYNTQNDIKFEIKSGSSNLNRIKIKNPKSTIYFDKHLAVKDHNFYIDEFNSRNLKILL